MNYDSSAGFSMHCISPIKKNNLHVLHLHVAVCMDDGCLGGLGSLTTMTIRALYTGRKIAPNTGANATKFFTLATKS